MNFLTRTFLEDPIGAYCVLIAAGLVLVAVWQVRRARWARIALLSVIGASALTAVLDAVVTTDRERIDAAVDRIVEDVQDGQLGVLAEFLSEDYRGLGTSRRGALDLASRQLGRAGIRDITLHGMEITVRGQSASQTFVTLVTGGRAAHLRWHVQWALREGMWKIVHVASPKFEPIGAIGQGR